MAVIDVFTYNGEAKVLKLHLGVLYNYVDKFIIVEANKTFTGNDKPLYFSRDQQFVREFWPKIEYYIMNEWDDDQLWQQAIESPNTTGASHWRREFYIKESIHKALKKFHVKDEDTLLIGDCDEIIDPMVEYESDTPIKAKLRVYAYWLNNRSTEAFWGTLIAQYKDIKDKCLNHMRSDKKLYSKGDYLGWHFSSMGGVEEVRRKLNDSYTPETYNTFDVQQKLPERIRAGTDYLGRDFKFTLDETHWPKYLVDNKDKFKSCIKS